jgi:ribosomal protein L32
MDDLISRQAAIEAVRKCQVKEVTPAYMLIDKAGVMTELMMLSSAQPKTGKWIPTQNPQWKAYYHDKCSVCGWWNTKNAVCRDSKKKAHSLNYCPNCGAMMKEGE